jgi:predicted transcriptional regulator of viral defense system
MKRVSFEYPEIDSLQLQQSLKDYAFPRDRVTKLLATGDLIRIKKGIYIDPHSQYPYSKGILANLIYGPSYVSLEYALQHHNLIPEAVHVVTSVTTGREKRYRTPVGDFDYAHMPQRFSICCICGIRTLAILKSRLTSLKTCASTRAIFTA